MSKLSPCRYCGNPPGTKVGPPAMARCLTIGCKGRDLAAVTIEEWNGPAPVSALDTALTRIRELEQDAARRHEAFIRVTASLAAAISLLERTPKAKSAAPSNTMFAQMLGDYRNSLEIARAALSSKDQEKTNG